MRSLLKGDHYRAFLRLLRADGSHGAWEAGVRAPATAGGLALPGVKVGRVLKPNPILKK